VPKRITLLRRRRDLDPERFSRHWSTVHAEIAKDLPGVERYLQNHLAAGSDDELDGVVELWFADEDAAAAGFGSEVADRLKSDELNFLEGLTGCAYLADGPHEAWPHKVWVFAEFTGLTDRATALEAIAERFSAVRGIRGHRIDEIDEASPRLVREALRVIPVLPRIAVSAGFAETDAADAFAAVAAEFLPAGLVAHRVIRARELVIV
jgi:uncharacterized protein (TIGR02118 family)